MSDIPENWRIDRIPTRRQRIFTIVVAAFLVVLFGLLGGAFAWMLLFTPEMREKGNIYFFLGVIALLLISVYVLMRAIKGEARKPSAFKAKLIGYFVLAMSVAFISMALLGGDYDNKFYLLALSFTGIPMGISILKQAKALEKRP